MTIDEMIVDFCKRSKTEYKPEHIKTAMKYNFSIVNEYGFIIFSIVQDECHGLFSYVVPGSPKKIFKDFMDSMERVAKIYGCRRIVFITMRDKPLGKILKDYQPTKAVVFEKRLV